MSIKKRATNDFVLECDECGRKVKGFVCFDEAVAYKKDCRWKSENNNGEWRDLCENCKGDNK